MVIGTDDRVQINNTTKFPFRAIGQLWSVDDQDNWSICSATLISERAIKVAVRVVKRRSPLSVVVALPVAPPETVAELALEAEGCMPQPALALPCAQLSLSRISSGDRRRGN